MLAPLSNYWGGGGAGPPPPPPPPPPCSYAYDNLCHRCRHLFFSRTLNLDNITYATEDFTTCLYSVATFGKLYLCHKNITYFHQHCIWKIISYLWDRVCSIFSGAGKFFLAYQIRISACFTCAYKSYLTHVISPGAG